MQTERYVLNGGVETLFSNKDPFYQPPQLSSHYHPSDKQTVCDPSIVLTPEKRKRFSFEELGNYSPLNYSFTEEDLIPEKLKEVPYHSKIIQEPVDENKSKQKPESEYSKYSDDLNGSLNFNQLQMISTQEKPPVSNISRLVNRFRHGKPLPSSDRRPLSSINSRVPPSGPSKIPVRQSSKPPISTKKNDNAKNTEANESILELQKKVERILQESQASLSAPTPLSGFMTHSNLTTPPFSPTSTDPEVMGSNPADDTLPKTYYPVSVEDLTSENSDSSGRPSSLLTTHYEPINNRYDKTPLQPSYQPPFHTSYLPVEPQIGPTKQNQMQPSKLPNSPIKPSYAPTKPHETTTKSHFQTSTPSYEPYKPSYTPVDQIDDHKDDILQRWRLRRKMEEAKTSKPPNICAPNIQRAQLQQPPNYPYQPQFPQNIPQPYLYTSNTPQPQVYNPYPPCINPIFNPCYNPIPAEKPFTQQQPYPYHCSLAPPGCVLVERSPEKCQGHVRAPLVSTKTQTTPKSSVESVSDSSTVRIKRVKDNVELHKVTMVEGTSTQTKSPQSPAWTDLSNNSSLFLKNKFKRKKNPVNRVKENGPKASPTTTMVKQVVSARLFDVSSTETLSPITSNKTEDKTLGQSFIESTSTQEKTEISQITPPSTSPTLSPPESNSESNSEGSTEEQPVEDQQSVLESILRDVERDPNDFPDDTVLASLRQQRSTYIQQLRKIDADLEKLKEDQP